MNATQTLRQPTSQATLETMERLLLATAREGLASLEAASDGGLLLYPRGGAGPKSDGIYLPLARSYTMGRFDLASLPLLGQGGPPISGLAELLSLLYPDLEDVQRTRLLAEVENGRENMAQSLKAQHALGIGRPGQGSLADWEGRVWLGHPLHPGARLRSGVTAEDNRRYGPEWQPRLALPLLEMPREDLVVCGDLWTRLRQLYPRVELFSGGERVAVPVHPWAAENDLPGRFADHLSSGRWRFSKQGALTARPSMSFRSVILAPESGRDTHLKLPVAVQTTGATRTVSVAAAHNGPLLSRFLRELWKQPAFKQRGLFDRLHLMDEPASFRLADDSGDRARFLAGILRTGPGPAVDGERWLLPAAALIEPRDNPLFLRTADHYGVTPLALWQEYCARLLPAQAYLCGSLGIALEAHPQNVVLDLRGPAGRMPEIHFHYRDLGGIRLHREIARQALAELGLEGVLEVPEFWPGSATSTDSVRDVSSKFIYSLLQNHLGELCRAVVRSTGEAEAPYWDAVSTILEKHRWPLGEDLASRVFASQWDLKSMWRMRIDSAVTEYTYAPVRNPWMTRQ